MSEIAKKCLVILGLMVAIALANQGWQAGKWVASQSRKATNQEVLNQASRMTLVVGPMLPIKVSGKKAHALGTDVCPGLEDKTMNWLFGTTINVGMSQCIVITPETTSVRVSLLAEGSLGDTEIWQVERNVGRVSFRRADGSEVLGVTDIAEH